MGTGSSSQKPKISHKSPKQCSYCTAILPQINNNELPSLELVCKRCHGTNLIPRISNSLKNKNIKNNTNINIQNNNIKRSQRYLQHIYIAPFKHTININEEKNNEITSSYLIDQYLKPFFNKNRHLIILSGNRIIIKGIEFKIYGCYPPQGCVYDGTKFHLNDEKEGLLMFNKRSIQKIDIVATKTSINAYKKYVNSRFKEDDVFPNYIKPYLIGNDSDFFINANITNINDFEIINNNNNNNNNNNSKEEKNENGDELDNENENEIKMPEYFNKRHLYKGEVFISNGIQFRVMECIPDDGFIDKYTQAYNSGEPLVDCKSVKLRALYGHLPNNHKILNPRQIKELYLDPYFKARLRYLDNPSDINIFGVSFSVEKCVPLNKACIVTNETIIDWNYPPISHEELKKIQEQRDLDMAMRLQEEEDRINNNHIRFFGIPPALPSNNNNNNNSVNNQNNVQQRQITLNDLAELFESRLQQSNNNNNNVNGNNANGNNNNNNNNINDPFALFIRQLRAVANEHHQLQQQQQQIPKGLHQTTLDRLPSWKFKSNKNNNNIENNDNNNDKGTKKLNDNNSCRICLEKYENDEILTCLPCFHKYHKDCIDKWLSQWSKDCPICKSPVDSNM